MRVAIHQPNGPIPWFPFFYKMASCDKFIILKYVQFEKNGYQNRFRYKDKWITKPVKSGVEEIAYKQYADGKYVCELNLKFIRCFNDLFSIKTQVLEEPIGLRGRLYENKTQRLIDLVKWAGGDTYVTNPEAKNKYLDEDLMRAQGLNVEYCQAPKHLQKSTFEVIEDLGITGVIKNLPRRHEELTAIF